MTELVLEAEREGIMLLEDRRIGRLKGLYIDGHIVLNPSIETYKEKRCILAEEIGHYYTSCGNILDQSKVENRKQERRARGWAYEKLIGPDKIIDAFKHGVQNRYELAEYLNVTEKFIEEALEYFKTKYYPYRQYDEYCITFDPLGVFKSFKKR